MHMEREQSYYYGLQLARFNDVLSVCIIILIDCTYNTGMVESIPQLNKE